MNATTIAKALGGRRTGGTWMARCPCHADNEPSLAIRDASDGRVLVHCHAGCRQGAVVAALRDRGLWSDGHPSPCPPKQIPDPAEDNGDAGRRAAVALFLWRTSRPAAGTPVVTYLASRGLSLPIPPMFRFHPNLKHPSGGTWPAMVALVTRGIDNVPVGIHRTFLTPDGSGKAPVVPQKMMLGPCRGGIVRLGVGIDGLMVGEGLETALSAAQATGRPAWAALSTAGLRSLDLPGDARDVTILADGDRPGETAAQDAARRWCREGRRVRIARAPAGMDFNDVLVSSATGEAAP